MSFKFFIFKFLLAFLCGYLLFKAAVDFTILKSASTPWVILTLILSSSGYCVQALFKLPETDEHPSLSSAELRRLRPVLSIKKTRLTIVFIYHIISATVIALGFFSINLVNPLFPKFFSLAGGLIFSCLYSFFYVKSALEEIQTFKSKLIHRAENEKRKKELIDSITKKPD